jgi:hypothetical protein
MTIVASPMKSQHGLDDDVVREQDLLLQPEQAKLLRSDYILSPLSAHVPSSRRSLYQIPSLARVALSVITGASICAMLYRSAVWTFAAVAVDAVVIESQAASSPSSVPDYFVTVPELFPGMRRENCRSWNMRILT